MSNRRYAWANQKLASASIDWINDDIRMILTRGYIVDLDAHQNLTHVSSGTRVAEAVLSGKTVDDPVPGVCDADDGVFTAVPAGAACDGLVIYKRHSSGLEAQAILIAHIDTATNLPVTPAGDDIGYFFDNGSNRVFAI